jgi:hypothetical protein
MFGKFSCEINILTFKLLVFELLIERNKNGARIVLGDSHVQYTFLYWPDFKLFTEKIMKKKVAKKFLDE